MYPICQTHCDESRCRIVVLWPSLLSKTRFQTLCMIFFIFFVIIFFPSQSQHTMRRLQEDFFLPSHAHKTKATYFFLLTPMFFFKWAGALVCDVAQWLGSAQHSACTACSAAEAAQLQQLVGSCMHRRRSCQLSGCEQGSNTLVYNLSLS